MPLFPYDDYEDEGIDLLGGPPRRRRRDPYFEDALDLGTHPRTTPVLPDSVGLGAPDPTVPTGRIPGATPPTFPSERQSRYGEMSEARDVYLKGTPGRGKSAIINAIKGALGGLASGQGALPGAVTGAIGGAIDPRGAREQEFNRRVRPQILERFGYEDQERAQQRQSQQDALDAEYKQAQIGALNRSNQPAPPKQPSFGSSPLGIYNQQTGQVTTPAQPKEPSATYRETYTGRVFNIADPRQRAEYEAIQAHGPRDRQGRFVSRADERAQARAAAPRRAKEAAKYVSRSQIRKYAEENNISSSDAAAVFQNKGYRISN
jgi:hypothetical protein